MNKQYGIELILDLSNCDITLFTRPQLSTFFKKIAKITDMKLALSPYFWNEENGGYTDEPHLKGLSAFHFIETSNITVHCLELLKSVFVNLFTCKDFNIDEACMFIEKFFKGKIINKSVIKREYV